VKRDGQPEPISDERWVLFSELFKIVETELGVSEFTARKRLRPDLENLNIDAQFRRLPPDMHRPFAYEGAVFPNPRNKGSAITKKGWQGIDELGQLVGWPVSVRWAHVVEALADLIDRSAIEPEYSPALARKRGGRDYRKNDASLVDAMHELITARNATSPHNAALKVADRAAGGGTLESKAKRLVTRYSERFSSEPNDVD
jgi:hypothetical protein